MVFFSNAPCVMRGTGFPIMHSDSWVSPWVLLMVFCYLMLPLLPPPPLSPSFFSRARWRIMAEKPKESRWSRRSAEGESMSEPSISRLPLFLLFIRPFIYPSSLYNPRPLSHSRSSLVFECIILTCHFRVYDVLIYCQVAPAHPCRSWNKSQWSGGDETAGWVFLLCVFSCFVSVCVCVCVSERERDRERERERVVTAH